MGAMILELMSVMQSLNGTYSLHLCAQASEGCFTATTLDSLCFVNQVLDNFEPHPHW